MIRNSLTLIFGLILMSCASQQEENGLRNSKDSALTEKCVPMSEVIYRDGRAFLQNEPFTGVTCSYFPSGSLHTLTTYEAGYKQGLWEIYYNDGKKEKYGFTRNGKDDGIYREYYPNGQLKYEYRYDLGKKVGIWRSWYEDGTNYTERHFENDRLNGKVLVWDESGKLAKEYDYVNGRLVNSEMHFKKPGY